jgi:excisionase family DNA binding protein
MPIITDQTPGSEHSTDASIRLIGVGEAAAILDVSPQTVARWADDGVLPCERTAGGHRRFREDVVLAERRRLEGGARS